MWYCPKLEDLEGKEAVLRARRTAEAVGNVPCGTYTDGEISRACEKAAGVFWLSDEDGDLMAAPYSKEKDGWDASKWSVKLLVVLPLCRRFAEQEKNRKHHMEGCMMLLNMIAAVRPRDCAVHVELNTAVKWPTIPQRPEGWVFLAYDKYYLSNHLLPADRKFSDREGFQI